MKKILFLLIATLVTSIRVNAQNIQKNEVDKFTKSEIIETSNETLFSRNPMFMGITNSFDFIIRRYNGAYVIAADILMHEIVKYEEGNGVTFLLDNGEIVELTTNYTGVGGNRIGPGYEFSTSFSLTDEDVQNLKQHKITDVRITYLGGSYDHKLKEKKQDLIQRMLDLFSEL